MIADTTDFRFQARKTPKINTFRAIRRSKKSEKGLLIIYLNAIHISNKNCCVVQIFSQSCNIFIPNDNLGTTINSCLFGFTIENRILGVSKFKSICFQSDQNFWPRPEILCFFLQKRPEFGKKGRILYNLPKSNCSQGRDTMNDVRVMFGI